MGLLAVEKEGQRKRKKRGGRAVGLFVRLIGEQLSLKR